MTSLWLPGATRVAPSSPGGQMDGTSPLVCLWHTVEAPDEAAYFDGALHSLIANSYEPHLLWSPATGRVAQLLPANVSARALANDGQLRTNRVGRIRVQIEVMGHAAQPFTAHPMTGLTTLLAWLDQLGIPRRWPFGQPLAYGPDPRRPGVNPAAYGTNNGTRDLGTYMTASGHMAHSNVPGNDHGDPGAVDINRLTPTVQQPGDDMTVDELDAYMHGPKGQDAIARAVWAYHNPATDAAPAQYPNTEHLDGYGLLRKAAES